MSKMSCNKSFRTYLYDEDDNEYEDDVYMNRILQIHNKRFILFDTESGGVVANYNDRWVDFTDTDLIDYDETRELYKLD